MGAWERARGAGYGRREILCMLGLASLSATGLLGACAPAGMPVAGVVAVEVTMTDDLKYAPAEVTVPVGGMVRWRNTTPIVHTVTGDPAKAVNPANVKLPPGAQPFDSGEMPANAVFSHTFTVPGEYVYFCIPHEAAGMVGKVTVR
ncbi:MAG: hypothetical protein HYY04_03050 [Chloroflexi bacterium]|nr:hypothetical protein [Chloroflexota bacterium]